MANARRIEEPGFTYHVTSNALEGMSLFRNEVDRLAFFDLLLAEVKRSAWRVLAYSLMTTHYHLLLMIEERTLSSGFQHLHSQYARGYNRRHRRRGVVWQKRFHDEVVTTERHLYETIRYIALNAPRAKACATPEEWPWCGYGAAIGLHEPDPLVDERELLGLFGTTVEIGRRRLREVVEECDPRERRRRPAGRPRATVDFR